ncbi:MAG TPA: NAD(P)/FAD-dependent oxidoreductase [Dehalococcoidia bacterium]|nr:NAD(P)/FAD-dependent oxidoreductase [Dehalococcoidia bacterium]
MAEKSIIIIGGGIAGLSAGCYGQMNGYRTSIFELHDKPGGVCTAWKRKGYTIDGCIHWLVGTNPANDFYRIWEELGALPGQTIVDHDRFLSVEGKGGKVFTVYADIDRLEQHMKELAPEDKKVIDAFIKGARACTRTSIDMPIGKAPELYGPIEGLKLMFKMMPFLRLMRKWGKTSTLDFSRRFKNPFMRQAFSAGFGGDLADGMPLLFMFMTLAWLNKKEAGYTIGGSLEFSRAIERRYLALGGEINYKSAVAKILVENDKAVGVRLADGTEHRGDIVISAADGRTTIFDMLDGKYIDDKIRGYYHQPHLFPPLVYVGLGVKRSFADMPPSVAGINFPLDKPVTIAGKKHRRMGVHIYNFDPSLAPKGKTALKVQFNTDYDYWKKLSQDLKRYKAEKEQIADQVVAALDQRFPGLAAQVEMRDVATPMTWERVTGNWRGSYEGWFPTIESAMKSMSKILPGLDNFYMTGQWVEPGGGLPTAAMSGRNVTQIICKKDKRAFVTTTP